MNQRTSRAPSKSVRLPLAEEILRPTFSRERAAMKRGVWPVAGCDEAGRGPLAGPVVAAAVVLDPKRIPRGLNDSKKLDARRARKALRQDLRDRRSRGRLRLDRAHRPRQHPARFAMGAGARGARAAGAAEARVRRRPRQDRRRLRLRRGDLAAMRWCFDCGRLDRRQGDARPSDDAAWRCASRLRLRAPHGLQRARALRSAGPARADHPSPPLVRAGCGQFYGD